MRLRTVILSAAAALVVNVAVAWAFAIAYDMHVITPRLVGTTVPPRSWPGPVPSTWDEKPEGAERHEAIGLTVLTIHGIRKEDRDRVNGFIPWVTVSHDSVGLPFRALARDHFDQVAFNVRTGEWVRPNPWSWREGLTLKDHDLATGSAGISLPLIVEWPGFLTNWTIYTVCVLAWPACREIRRRVRRQCLACGYQLSGAPGTPCSECGSVSAGSA